eukprot:CAMPEP_0116901834 /NCGR_PEP_ID=MMETSP0467-20121206/9620_1 /TAXON_ID=283647 /ORGANISM="Mesodinium pulex, Strain SPMC105" /LENGTH=232 /DNA_ID=CAMNT_0004575485 /DNA_START=375 /DNA_END=1073 /DNA_ORIENTATION=+
MENNERLDLASHANGQLAKPSKSDLFEMDDDSEVDEHSEPNFMNSKNSNQQSENLSNIIALEKSLTSINIESPFPITSKCVQETHTNSLTTLESINLSNNSSTSKSNNQEVELFFPQSGNKPLKQIRGIKKIKAFATILKKQKLNNKCVLLDRVESAAEMIDAGFNVCFPTETVFGIGADVANTRALENIFKVKNRPRSDPLIVHVHSIDTVTQWLDLNATEQSLLDLILQK